MKITLDKDPKFQGERRSHFDEGVHLEFCPAEAHWQMGNIARHSDAFREQLNRVIKAQMIVETTELEFAVSQRRSARTP